MCIYIYIYINLTCIYHHRSISIITHYNRMFGPRCVLHICTSNTSLFPHQSHGLSIGGFPWGLPPARWMLCKGNPI